MSYHRQYKLKDDRFGLLTQTMREKARLTQNQVADALGLSERSVQHWEAGTTFPNVDHLKQLLEIYLHRGVFIIGNERDEAKAFWDLSMQSAPHRRKAFDEGWFSALLKQQLPPMAESSQQAQAHEPSPTTPLQRRDDWGQAIEVAALYGREPELAILEQWVLTDRCRITVLLGMGGIGKTVLSLQFAHQVAPHFTFVFWRSLRNAPPLEEVLADFIQTLSEQQYTSAPQSLEESITLLIDLLQKRRCLLVLDNVETLLQAGSAEGRYRDGYEGYDLLIQRVAETAHQSCLILTSREMLGELEPLEGRQSAVRVLKLFGLERSASQHMLEDKELFGAAQDWDLLVQRYEGNPLALKIAAVTAREVFGGNLATFLREGSVLPRRVRQLLDFQFDRLSPLERDLLYWLAIERDPATLKELSADLVGPVSRSELLTALKSLRWRCLIERAEKSAIFTLQGVVLEYVSERLVDQVCDEITGERPTLLLSHALMRVDGKDYIRDTQVRMLIQPILIRLVTSFSAEQRLQHMLQRLREMPYAEQGYGGGNIVNLLASLKGHIRGVDFSHLLLRKAYLKGIEAQDASFAESEFADSLFTEPIESIVSMVLSPDGRYLALGSWSGQISFWLVLDEKPLLTVMGHSRMVWALAFSQDSMHLASGGYDHSVRLWEVKGERGEFSGQCLRTLQGHHKWVRVITFSPDGTLLASAGDDETVRIWDVRDGTCLNILHGHSGRVLSVAFQPTGNLIASGGEDGQVNLWDARSGRCLQTLRLHTTRAASVAFSPDRNLLASGNADGEVEVWQIGGASSPSWIRTLHGHSTFVSAVAFGPNGLLASNSYGGKVKFWDVESGRCLSTLQGYSRVICSVSFNPDGNLLVHGDESGMLSVWEVNGGGCLRTFQGHTGHIWSVTFSPDGKTFASGGTDQSLKLWEASSGRQLKTFLGHTSVIWSVAFSPDGSLLASSSFDRTVKLWGRGSEDGESSLRTFQGHATVVWSLAFTPDGSLLASGDNDGEIKLWEVGTGQCLKTLRGRASPVGALAFSSNGKTLISSYNDEGVTQWEVSSGQCLKTLPGQGLANWIGAMTFSRDGKMLARGNTDRTIKLWQAEEESSTHSFRAFSGNKGQVWSVAFSLDGSLLASGDDEGTITIWDTHTGTDLHTWRSERPYERMNIRGVKGLFDAQKVSLKALGAFEEA